MTFNFAWQQSVGTNVRFGSQADIAMPSAMSALPPIADVGTPPRDASLAGSDSALATMLVNVRIGSEADICSAPGQVRFGVTADIAARATHRKAKLILPIIQIATAATSPALTNTPDTTAALNRITPNAYAILSSAHRITLMKRPNTQ